MDQNPEPELSLDESVKEVMQALPPVVRTYLAEGKYTAVAKSLMSKYGLRIDQGGVLEREIMLLLMGIENPDEFIQTLATDARLDQQTIDSIVQDINTQIFVPLRQEEERGRAAQPSAMPASQRTDVGVPSYAPPPPRPSPQATEGTAPIAPRPTPPAPMNPAAVFPPAGNYAPPPQSPRYPNQESSNVNAFVRRVPQTPPAAPRPSISVIAPPPARPVPQMAPRQAPPINLPGALPPPDIMLPAPKAPLLPAPAQYSTDPYHEPIE